MRSRKLYKEDFILFENHLKRLSPEERLLRFDFVISDEQIHHYVQNINVQDIVIGLFSSNQVIGAAHLSVSKHESFEAGKIELGISVETEYQGLGLGTDLMYAAMTIGEHEGFKKLEILCQSQNLPMIRIANKFGAVIKNDHGHTYAYIDLIKDKNPVKINKHELGLASMRTNVIK